MSACVVCTTPLKTRSGSRYCSRACQQKAYRDRKNLSDVEPRGSSLCQYDSGSGASTGLPRVSGPPNVTFTSQVPVTITFAAELMFALEEHARRGGTAIGAVQVARRVARKHNLPGMQFAPLPRWTRAEYEDLDPALRSKNRFR